MNRRPGFIVTILIVIFSLIGFYIYLKRQQSPLTQPIHAIPIDVSLFIEIHEPANLIEKCRNNSLVDKLSEIDKIYNIKRALLEVDSVINKFENLRIHFQEKSILISFHEIAKNKTDKLFLTKLSGKFEANQIFKTLNNNLIDVSKSSHKRYNQVKIYKTVLNKEPFYYGFHRGVLMGSSSELLIQDAIRQVESANGLQTKPEFVELLKTAGDNVDANVFIQLAESEHNLSEIFSVQKLKSKNLEKIGNWVSLDLNLKNNTFLLNGFNGKIDETDFQSIFKEQKPVNLSFQKFTPVGINSILAFGISNYEKFKHNLQLFMDANGQLERFSVNQKAFRDAFGQNAENELIRIFDKEIVQTRLSDDNMLFFIKTNGYRDAQELILKWLNNYCNINNVSIANFEKPYKLDEESKFPVYKLPLDYIPTRLFGPWFKDIKAEYVTIFDDYLIFSSDYKALTRTLYNNILQKTLSFDGAFTQYADFLSSKVNMFAFVSTESLNSSIKQLFSADKIALIKENQSVFNDLFGLSWQLSNENGLMYNNLLLKNQPSKEISAATQWETRLDTLIAFKPEIVINHNTGNKEIFIQDLNNNVYLINKEGRILWKKKINESIIGGVHQVDCYKNGKLQFLFNTKSKIYLLDRNGNPVERFPIALQSETQLPLALFDYDNKKNYRLFISGMNRKVYLFNIKGKRITGFKFKGADNEIIAPVQHVRDNNKDYIVVTDKSRIYLLNRRGETRISLKKQFTPSVKNQFIYQKGNSNRRGRLIRTDAMGKIYFIYFNGDVEEKKVDGFSTNHFFSLRDITGDNIYDFIFLDKDKLEVFSLSGKKEFSYKFDSYIKHSPSFYKFSSKNIYTGVTDSENRKIYLIDGKGKIVDGFPLLGKTKFSVGFMEKKAINFNLIVGGDEQYLYNYKLN